jgi:hypothetical protein
MILMTLEMERNHNGFEITGPTPKGGAAKNATI